jgi:hypothetical protein
MAGLALVAGACTYDPDIESGTLVCGNGMSCPKGYSCASDGACWKEGSSPSDDPLANFVGKWAFDSGTLNSDCSATEPATMSLAGDYVVLVKGGTGLVASYYCDWTLHRPLGTTKATLDPGQSCNQVVTPKDSKVTYTYMWSGKSFTFSTQDGVTATVSGQVAGPYTGTDGSTGMCDGSFDGKLTKVPM